MKIIAFGASHSKTSINKQFATYVSSLFPEATVEVLDLNEYELPLYTIDLENENGIPTLVNRFLEKLQEADLVILSLAEHNGSYTAGFKNLMDWTSRLKAKFLEGIKVLLLATSPGGGGARFVLEAAETRFPRHGALIVGSFSLPNFNDNFSKESGILASDLKDKLMSIIDSIEL